MQERRKIRKQARKEKQQEAQDEIRLGLRAPPPAKGLHLLCLFFAVIFACISFFLFACSFACVFFVSLIIADQPFFFPLFVCMSVSVTVKLSNLMRVLVTEATMDPTRIEQEVRRQMDERRQAHEDRNHARMLTPEARYVVVSVCLFVCCFCFCCAVLFVFWVGPLLFKSLCVVYMRVSVCLCVCVSYELSHSKAKKVKKLLGPDTGVTHVALWKYALG